MTRAKLIQLVHIGAAKLFPGDDDARRAWQAERTGHASCTDMSDADLENLVAELRRKRVLASPGRNGGRAQGAKVRALWIDLRKRGRVSDGSDRALGRWLHRMVGKYNPDWLTPTEARRAIEALKQWRDRPEPPKGAA